MFAARSLTSRVLATTTTSAASLRCHYRLCSTTPNPQSGGDASASRGKGNFFAFFGIEKQPQVDVSALQKLYHTLQMEVHPDMNVNPSPSTIIGASAPPAHQQSPCVPDPNRKIDVSTYANGAYETLKDAYRRCRYLSRLEKAKEVKGAALTPAEEEELLVEDDQRTMKARDASPDIPLSEEFLMEVLAMNELIFGGDREVEAVRNQMKVLSADLEDRCDGCYESAKAAWAKGAMQTFHHVVLEWTYYNNALHHLKNRL